ncbi:caspase family protein [Paucibacter soli]|uniref:caspase family protein n=1 Tax=Paucibacter soli TaxID=3133433 RepID=UPI0030AB5AA9
MPSTTLPWIGRAGAWAALLWCCALAWAEPAAPQLRIETGSHQASIRQLASDAQGGVLLTVSEDKTARLWRSADQRLLMVLRPPIGPGNEGKLYAGALTPDGSVAAVAGWSAENEVYLFRCADGQLLSRIRDLPNVVNRLAFSPDGRSLALLFWGGQGLQLQRSQDGWASSRLAGADPDYGGDAYGLAFSPDGKRLATSAYDGALRLYELRGGAPWLQRRSQLAGQPHGLAFSPEGARLAVGQADAARVAVLDAATLAPLLRLSAGEGGTGALSSVAWSPDGNQLLAAGTWRGAPARHGLKRWRLRDAQALPDLDLASDSITDLLPLPGDRLAFASADASWGLLQGERMLARVQAQRADFRANWGGFRLAADAMGLQFGFGFGGAEPARFELRGFAWRPPTQAWPAAMQQLPGLQVQGWQDGLAPTLNGRAIALEPGEMTTALALAADASVAALGSQWHVRLLNAQARELWRRPVSAPCFALQLSADGRWVVAAFGDGTIRWQRRSDGEEVLAFFAHGDRRAWVLWTPDGRFMAGQGGEQHVGWHLNRGPDQAAEFLPLARFSERRFDPRGVFSALTEQPGQAPAEDPRQGLKLPPLVSIAAPTQPPLQGKLALLVRALDRGGGLDELRLYLNGKLVTTLRPDARSVKAGALEQRFELTLERGDNLLRAVALASDRTESAPAELALRRPDEAPSQPGLRLLTVGVNSYRNGQLNLNFSVPDARGLAKLFRAAGSRLFGSVQVTELLDERATKLNIMAGLRELGSSSEEDVVVVYLAGHGETLRDEWYFIPHELTRPEQEEQLRAGGLSARELAEALRAMPARKVVVLIDACKSGAAVLGFRGLEERRVLSQLARATGTHLIAATTKEQLASELDVLGHGIFTYALLEGLAGKAAAQGRDITARKLMVYVEQALPELSMRYRSEEQFPVVSSTGMDFPLLLR